MARGKSKSKRAPRYFKTLYEARNSNPVTLAKYLRERFGQEAKAAEGKEALLAKVVKIHEVKRRPLQGDEDTSTPPSQATPAEQSTATTPAAPAQPQADAGIAQVGEQFADAILGRLNVRTSREVDTPPECASNEHWEGAMRVTAVGDFEEAVTWPVLQRYRRERDMDDFTYFRAENSDRRLMLGKIVMIGAQENYQGAVSTGVNGKIIDIPREKTVGVPLPHWKVLLEACNAEPVYANYAKDVPQGTRDDVPPPPPPPSIKKMPTYYMNTMGDCLCDPRTLEVVVPLSQMVTAMRNVEVSEMELAGSPA